MYLDEAHIIFFDLAISRDAYAKPMLLVSKISSLNV